MDFILPLLILRNDSGIDYHLSLLATIDIKNYYTKNGNLKIYNLKGNLKKEIQFNNSNKISFYRDNFISGLYFFTLQNEDKSILTGTFIVE